MSPILQLLLELSILITAAKLAGLISSKFGQPAVLGEILAVGLLLGPSLLNLPAWPVFTSPELQEVITELAEIGVIFLMFLAGLEATWIRCAARAASSVLAGVLGVTLAGADGHRHGPAFQLITPASRSPSALLTPPASASRPRHCSNWRLRSKEGSPLLGAAVVDDVLVILLLSVFVAIGQAAETGRLASSNSSSASCCS